MNGLKAYELSLKNPYSKWPGRNDERNRLYPDCEPSFNPSFHMQPGESIFTIGSCFARNVERQLALRGFAVPAMAFSAPEQEAFAGPVSNVLNKYTPPAMLNEVEYAFAEPPIDDPNRFFCEGRAGEISDYQLHVRGTVSLERAIERRLQVRSLFKEAILSSRVIVITLGLIEAWFDLASDLYLNESPSYNMVRKYPDRYEFRLLSKQQCGDYVDALIALLQKARGGDLAVVLTVSPVPILRTFTEYDVIVANMYSKSVLRVVAHEISAKYDFVDYFPSYESVILSENSSTWVDDQVHVTVHRVEAIISRMVASYAQM